jgi:hypothetical protein
MCAHFTVKFRYAQNEKDRVYLLIGCVYVYAVMISNCCRPILEKDQLLIGRHRLRSYSSLSSSAFFLVLSFSLCCRLSNPQLFLVLEPSSNCCYQLSARCFPSFRPLPPFQMDIFFQTRMNEKDAQYVIVSHSLPVVDTSGHHRIVLTLLFLHSSISALGPVVIWGFS